MTFPPDLPDDLVDAMPVFTSRRRAEMLPPLRAAERSNGLDPDPAKTVRIVALEGWQAGFRWGVVATVGGLMLVAVVAVRVLQ